jgi:hypothetical protein
MQASDSYIAAPEHTSDVRLQRILKVVVVALAILLFAGLAAVIGRVIYLATPSTTQPAAPTPAVRPEQSLALPFGAQVRSISLAGNRLAVHYDLGASAGIAVLDLQSGRLITNVAIEPKRPGR